MFFLVFLSYPGELQKKCLNSCLDSKSIPLGLLMKLWSRPKLSQWIGSLQVLKDIGRNREIQIVQQARGRSLFSLFGKYKRIDYLACIMQESLGFLKLFMPSLLLQSSSPWCLPYGCWKRASDLPGEQKSRTYPVPVVLVGVLCCPGDQQPRKRPKSPWKRQH